MFGCAGSLRITINGPDDVHQSNVATDNTNFLSVLWEVFFLCVLLLLHLRSSACDFGAGQGGGMAIESSYIRVASDDSTYVQGFFGCASTLISF